MVSETKANNQPWIAAQIFSFSPFEKQPERFDETLRQIKNHVDLKALMIGAAIPERWMERILSQCQHLGIQSYLWFPVLADFPDPIDITQVTTIGYEGDHPSFILQTQKDSGEDFTFACPSREMDIDLLTNPYRQRIQQWDFDGVFLDKIRFPSPSNGLSALLSCRCKRCQSLGSQQGLSIGSELFVPVLSWIKEARDLQSLRQAFERGYDTLRGFMDFREDAIVALVERYASFARQASRQVGIDLFTPSLAPFVSQHYNKLSALSDWVKPMLYMHTMGPAGLPLELIAIVKTIQNLNPYLSEASIWDFLGASIDLELPTSSKLMEQSGVSPTNIIREVDRARKSIPQGVRLYPGFDTVVFPPICTITPLHLDQYIQAIRQTHLEGFVISWDISRIPMTIFQKIGDAFGF